MADIAKKMKGSGYYRRVNLIFVNALFDATTGYNTLQTKKDKTDIFNRVLEAIEMNYHTDAILIACNTLSVIYQETEFVKSSKTPVIGIVEAGVQMISDVLKSDPSSEVIIFGTETTVEEGSHKNALLGQHFEANRITAKACPQLQSYIEQNPFGEETEMLIKVYLGEALEELGNTDGKVYLSLNCSHFGYSRDIWENAMKETPYKLGGILNPNETMGDILFDERNRKRFNDTEISFLVVSKTELLNVNSIFTIFNKNSPELAEALKNYSFRPDLFK